jgi:hypothetical protein
MGAIQRVWPYDATGTPIVSGAANSLAETSLTLVPIAGATRLKIKCSVAMYWGIGTALTAASAAEGQIPAAADEWVDIPTNGRASIFVKTQGGGAGDFYFFFYSDSTR